MAADHAVHDVTAADHAVQTQRWWAKQTQRAATPLQRPAQAPIKAQHALEVTFVYKHGLAL